jgi:hypothetical protein
VAALIVIGIVAAVAIIATKKNSTASSPSSSTSAGSGAGAGGSAPTAATTAKTKAGSSNGKKGGQGLPVQSGNWRLDSVTVTDDGGAFHGNGQITNTGSTAANDGISLFTVTLYLNGKLVAHLDGSANDVPAGGTVTVEFSSSEPYLPGPYLYAFQQDT